jgi:HD superfamily phosphodiesterase
MELQVSKAFELVMILCKKFNIDESHSLKHSMEVYNFALRIYESELLTHAYLEQQKDIIIIAAILHDTIDKKYVAEEIGIAEICEHLKDSIDIEKLNIIFKIITTMSYSTVKKNGFPVLGEYQLAYHIVREADLLAAYDIDRCIMYSMYTKQMGYLASLEAAIVLFKNRVLRHRKDRLIITTFSKKLSIKLDKKAKSDIDILTRNLHNCSKQN